MHFIFGDKDFTEDGLWMRQSDIKWMRLHPSNNTELLPTLIIPQQRHGGICVRLVLWEAVRSQGCELLAMTGAAFFMQCKSA